MLNEIQQSFLREFKQNIENYKNNFLILNGPAGSGKTRLIKESVEICLENGIDSVGWTLNQIDVIESFEQKLPSWR